MEYGTSDISSRREHYSQWNEKLVIQAVPIHSSKSDKVLAKICSPWIWKKLKAFIFRCK
jgi:hypothetical protein